MTEQDLITFMKRVGDESLRIGLPAKTVEIDRMGNGNLLAIANTADGSSLIAQEFPACDSDQLKVFLNFICGLVPAVHDLLKKQASKGADNF